MAKTLWKLSEDGSKIDQICGVPYTALPIATLISVDTDIPMLIKRKEAKAYGTKKMVEGHFKQGDHCIIIEDVVTSGSSILETVQTLRKEGLKVSKTLVVIDREQGGKKNIENYGIQMKSLFTVTRLMAYLLETNKIKPHIVKEVTDYLLKYQAPVVFVQGKNYCANKFSIASTLITQIFHFRCSRKTIKDPVSRSCNQS